MHRRYTGWEAVSPRLFQSRQEMLIMKISIKRIYDGDDPNDGTRILVDRLWPRGISKEKANISYWAKDISPSNELRKWYQHDPGKWDEFKQRYYKELTANPEALEAFMAHLTGETVTFLFSSKELELNNAAALKEYLELSP
jgi:uncharacterized protein YeaO (DUF488 family)